MVNFWRKLKKPIIGMAPMDGVTDAAFRYMVAKYSKPSVIFTEFVNVEGLARGGVKMLKAFLYNEIERPIVAQVFGVEPASFYKAAVLLASLGFDGIDINMGCPANTVAKKGSGAGLIKNPKLAQKIIKMTKKGVRDFAKGISLEKAGINPVIILAVKKMRHGVVKRKLIPVSVKTRIGYDKVVAESWTKTLLETGPDVISMHGRTLKQMYGGKADWEVLAKASRLTRGTNTMFLGNGDIESVTDAKEKIKKYDVDGVLVGRATMGNLWFFSGKEPTVKQRMKAIKEHCKYFAKFLPTTPFFAIRKHLAWYCKGFEGAKDLRVRLMKVEKPQDVEEILNSIENK